MRTRALSFANRSPPALARTSRYSTRRDRGMLPPERLVARPNLSSAGVCIESSALPGRAVKAVKGTRDLLPPSTEVWNRVESVAREVFCAFNYHEIRTPILEETQLFARGVGAETDIVTKEMYTFEDRDGSSLTLRPENTASVIRAYMEHRLDQLPGVQKLYYMGPMFRRERPAEETATGSSTRSGAEAIGSESPVVDAEVIEKW